MSKPARKVKGQNQVEVHVSGSLKTKIDELLTRMTQMEQEIADLKANGGQGMTPQEVLAIAYDPHERSRVSVIGRQAKRAGMTVADWLEHCKAKGHDPYLRDKDIPNHEAAGSRGGRKKKTAERKPKGQRELTPEEKAQAKRARDQLGLFGSKTKKKKSTK